MFKMVYYATFDNVIPTFELKYNIWINVFSACFLLDH